METKKVRDIMTREVTTLGRNDTLQLARDIMNLERTRHFPVMEEGEVVGVVSQRDIFHASLGSVIKYGEKAEREFLGTVTVKEVMSDPITVSPDTSIKQAAQLMVEKKIGCLPVVEEENLVGLITETDLLREVAEM